MYHPGISKYSLNLGVFLHMPTIIAGQPGRSARKPSCRGGSSMPFSSTTAATMPGMGFPMEPGLMVMER